MLAVERLSGADRAWLMMDRPTNRMTIVSLVIYSRPLPLAGLRALVEERFLAHERFRCYPEADALGARWVPDVGFDIANHVLTTRLPAGAGKHDLERLVGRLASAPFKPGRPLWTFHLIEHWQGGSAAIIRIHHCYADGIALSRVLLSLADGAAAVPAPEHHEAPAFHLPFGVGAVLEKGLHYALHPLEATTAAWDAMAFASELTHLGTMADDPPTRLKGPLSGVRRAAWLEPIPLEEVRTISHVLGCTINDVLISTLAGALGRYLEAHHDEVAGLTLRNEALERALRKLNERERRVLELRFGLNGEAPSTLDEVGRTFNVTRERIRQIENQSLKKLQSLAEAQKLRDVA